MPLAQLIASIRSAANASVVPFAQQVSDWFTAHPDIIVQSVDWARPVSEFPANQQTLRIAYLQATAPAIGGQWLSLLFQSASGQTAQDAFNTYFAALPALVPMFVLDITENERSRSAVQSLLVIAMRTDVGPLGLVGYDRAAFFANPLADIPAGDTGNATILDSRGEVMSASMPVTNVGTETWVQDERNVVVYDQESGVYIGIPSCCGASAWAAPAATTTTAYPCPTVFREVNPTTGTSQPTFTFPPTTTTTVPP